MTEQAGAPVYAFPGLQAGPEGVARRLFRTPMEAKDATARGLAALFEAQLGRDLMWTQRDLRALRELVERHPAIDVRLGHQRMVFSIDGLDDAPGRPLN